MRDTDAGRNGTREKTLRSLNRPVHLGSPSEPSLERQP
jgi:hypothetical protein